MPLYEYECDACGRRFEVIQKFSETLTECRKCGKGPVRRLLSPPAIQFKGTGWYITDYAQKGKSGSETAGANTEKSNTADGGDAKKSDSAAPTSGGKTESSSPAASAGTKTASKPD